MDTHIHATSGDYIHALFLQCKPFPEDMCSEFVSLRSFNLEPIEFKQKVKETLDQIFAQQDCIIVCSQREFYPMIQASALEHKRSVKIIVDPKKYRDSFRNAELCLCYERGYDFVSHEFVRL